MSTQTLWMKVHIPAPPLIVAKACIELQKAAERQGMTPEVKADTFGTVLLFTLTPKETPRDFSTDPTL